MKSCSRDEDEDDYQPLRRFHRPGWTARASSSGASSSGASSSRAPDGASSCVYTGVRYKLFNSCMAS